MEHQTLDCPTVAGKRKKTPSFLWFITSATMAKFLINTSKRMIYPFAPAIARGLGVGLPQVTSILALNQATSLLAPVAVIFGEKLGYKLLVLFSLMFFTIGMFAAGLVPLYWIVMAAFFLVGLSKSIIDPTIQAIAGSIVPLEKRGLVIGITEFAWAASSLVGLPITGIIIEKYNWQTPFLFIGCLSLACFFVFLKTFPSNHKGRGQKIKTCSINNGLDKKINMIQTWKSILKYKNVRAFLTAAFFMCLANDNLFVIYGAWLEDSFGLSLAAIGFGAVFIGLSEISGEMFTAFFSDKIGLKKSIFIGLALTALSYYLLMLMDSTLFLVLFGLFMVFFTFEFTIVTSMSLGTELVPELRASTMSLYFAAAGLGRVVGAILGGVLWSDYGITGICLVSGTCTVFSLIAMVWGFSGSLKDD